MTIKNVPDKIKPLKIKGLNGADTRTRTADPLITNQ